MIANPSIPHKEAKAMRNITEEPSNKSVLDSTFSSGGAGCERPQEVSTEKKLDNNSNSNNNNHESIFNKLKNKNTVKKKNIRARYNM